MIDVEDTIRRVLDSDDPESALKTLIEHWERIDRENIKLRKSEVESNRTKREGVATSERYWAVKIGRKRSYFAVNRDGSPLLFKSRNDSRQYRKKVLSSCGHKEVYAVPVELRASK